MTMLHQPLRVLVYEVLAWLPACPHAMVMLARNQPLFLPRCNRLRTSHASRRRMSEHASRSLPSKSPRTTTGLRPFKGPRRSRRRLSAIVCAVVATGPTSGVVDGLVAPRSTGNRVAVMTMETHRLDDPRALHPLPVRRPEHLRRVASNPVLPRCRRAGKAVRPSALFEPRASLPWLVAFHTPAGLDSRPSTRACFPSPISSLLRAPGPRQTGDATPLSSLTRPHPAQLSAQESPDGSWSKSPCLPHDKDAASSTHPRTLATSKCRPG